jgi:glycosyltransferase involved in cell wall biosynthesis
VKLGWSAILKNEAAIISRCLDGILPHVDYGLVVDTGSTDGTPDIVKKAFADAGKTVEIEHTVFHDFAQARNEALAFARASHLPWDYLVLSDADMALVVDDPDWKRQLNGGLAYDVRQVAGTLNYWNRRILSRNATGDYKCPTHEFLDVPTAGNIDGIWFKDHADGHNRPGKFERDIKLLEDMLKTETNEGLIQRAHFYLGQSYFDAKNWSKAAEHYKIRASLGGFAEERWNAQLHYAHALGNLGRHAEFLWEMLHAYQMRPSRAEVLYDAARFFRERGENHSSLLFSEAGMQIKRPDDQLFVNNFVYKSGCREEFSICAYYAGGKIRDRGAQVCNDLALEGSEQAMSNLYWYLKPLVDHVPSARSVRLQPQIAEGYAATNPSIINHQGKPMAIVRAVNYTITPEGVYAIRGKDGTCSPDWFVNPINTRNYLVHLSDDLELTAVNELPLPENWPEPKFHPVRGLEDCRLFEWQGGLWTISNVRELNPEGWCEQVMVPLNARGQPWTRILPKERKHEKNWMPLVDGDNLYFIYRLGTALKVDGSVFNSYDPGFDVSHISGGSQVIEVPGGLLCLVHEARTIPGRSNRYYQHRFALMVHGAGIRLSPPFVFHDKQIEFAAGLAYFPDEYVDHEPDGEGLLMASFGVMDREAWVSLLDLQEVLRFIEEPR